MKTKYIFPECPTCYKNKHVVSDGNGHGGGGFLAVSEGNGIIGDGYNHSYFYCTQCFTRFDIKTTYIKYEKDQRVKLSGNTRTSG